MPSIKIGSGKLGGRVLKTPKNRNLKPTPARVREQIFSWLKQSSYQNYIAAEYKPENGSNQSFTWKKKYFSDDVNI